MSTQEAALVFYSHRHCYYRLQFDGRFVEEDPLPGQDHNGIPDAAFPNAGL